MLYFIVLRFRKIVTLQSRILYLRIPFVKISILMCAERPLKNLYNSIINFEIFFTWIVISLLFDSMSLNVEVASIRSAISPLSCSLFISWFKHLKLGTIIELLFNKELNITFLLKSVINGATLIRAFSWLWNFKSSFVIIPKSFYLASAWKVLLSNSIDSLLMSLFIIK